jgi:Tol biopolymer transport system component
MNEDGSGVQSLTTFESNESSPQWSPDGQSIFFSGIDTGFYAIWRMNADGTNRQPLSSSTHHHELPALSPDGNQIAFSTDSTGNYEVFLMSSTGGAEQQVTDFPGGSNGWPRWSPGGEYIAFSRQSFDGMTRQAYVMKRDGSQVTLLNLPHPWVHIMDWQPR